MVYVVALTVKVRKEYCQPRIIIITPSKEIWLAYFKFEVELAKRAKLQSDSLLPERKQNLGSTKDSTHRVQDVRETGNLV